MKKKRKFGFKLFKLFAILTFITIGGSFLYVKFSPKVLINSANSLILYDMNNEVFFKGNESKEWVNLDDISPYLIDATISTEDKNFYKHFFSFHVYFSICIWRWNVCSVCQGECVSGNHTCCYRG